MFLRSFLAPSQGFDSKTSAHRNSLTGKIRVAKRGVTAPGSEQSVDTEKAEEVSVPWLSSWPCRPARRHEQVGQSCM